MAFMDYVKETITQKPAHLKKPHFYKADSDALRQLDQLKGILESAPSSIKARVEQDMRMRAFVVLDAFL